MAKYVGYKRPKDTKKTMKHFLTYLGHYKWAFFLVAILVFISAGAGICGTYLIKPLVNNFIEPGNMKGLLIAVIGMGVMYLCGALATLGYNRLMVHTSQKVVSEIRMDLFRHTQKLPLKYFDDNTRGEIMSHFTNDVDTVQEAMNNSFAMIIQSFLTLFGTITMMMVLSVKLTMLVVVFLVITFLFMQYNGKCSKKYYHRQQQELGNINGFVQEMMAGQKVEKVFNHEKENFKEFCEMNERFRRESTNALAHSGMLVPVIVALSYFNYALSACVGGMFVIRGLMDLGSLSAYLVYVRQSAMPLNQFTQQVNFLLSALSGAERIFDMMDETEEIDEGKVTLCNVCKNADGTLTECAEITGLYAWKLSSGELVLLKGDVRFHDVVFGYVSEKTVLNGISLFAKPGQKIAFVGSTGAGFMIFRRDRSHMMGSTSKIFEKMTCGVPLPWSYRIHICLPGRSQTISVTGNWMRRMRRSGRRRRSPMRIPLSAVCRRGMTRCFTEMGATYLRDSSSSSRSQERRSQNLRY